MSERRIIFSLKQFEELTSKPALATAFVAAYKASPDATTGELLASAKALMVQYDLFKEGKSAFQTGQFALHDSSALRPEQVHGAITIEQLQDAEQRQKVKH